MFCLGINNLDVSQDKKTGNQQRATSNINYPFPGISLRNIHQDPRLITPLLPANRNYCQKKMETIDCISLKPNPNHTLYTYKSGDFSNIIPLWRKHVRHLGFLLPHRNTRQALVAFITNRSNTFHFQHHQMFLGFYYFD